MGKHHEKSSLSRFDVSAFDAESQKKLFSQDSESTLFDFGAFFVFYPEKSVYFFSQSFGDLLSLDDLAVPFDTFLSFLAPEYCDQYKNEFLSSTDKGEYEFSFVLVAHGKRLKVTQRWMVAPMDGADESGRAVCGTLLIERPLSVAGDEREKQLHLALEGADLGLWDWDVIHDSTEINERWAGMLGYTKAEVLGWLSSNSWAQLIHPDDRDATLRALNRLVSGESSIYEVKFRLRHKDGSWVWVLSKGKVFEWIDGVPARAVGTHLDISQQKGEHENLELFFQVSIDMPAILGLDGTFLQVSPSWNDNLGYQTDELAGTIYADHVHEDDKAMVLSAFSALMSGKMIVRMEHRLIHKDGHVIWVLWNAVPEIDRQIIFSTSYEVTEQKMAELSIKESHALFEKANSIKNSFLASMSHEIRTPLNAIIGFTDLLQPYLKEERLLSYVESIRLAGESLMQLINDIIDLAKAESDELSFSTGPVSVKSLMESVQNYAKLQADPKGIALRFQAAPEMPLYINGDEKRLRQILVNLVASLVQLIDTGRIEVQAGFCLNKGKHFLEFMVFVYTSSLSADYRRLLLSFLNGDDPAHDDFFSYGSSGLGVVICKKFVDLLDGMIRVEDDNNDGIVLSVVIPAGICSDRESIVQENVQYDGKALPVDGPILVVDDVAINRFFLRELLESKKYEVIEAINGAEGVKLCLEHKPSLIFMDIRMPEMDGITALNTIRSHEEFRKTPVIALTASVTDNTILEEFDYFIPKPVHVDTLIEVLQKFFPYPAAIPSYTGHTEQESEEYPDQLASQEISDFKSSFGREIEILFGALKLDELQILAQRILEWGREKQYGGAEVLASELLVYLDQCDLSRIYAWIRKIQKMLSGE